MFYKIGEVHFRLLSTNGFSYEGKQRQIYCCWLSSSQSQIWLKISRRRLADYVKKLCQKACPACSMIFSPRSTNQIIDLWCCRCRCRPHFLNFLVSWEQRLSSQRTNLTGSPLINRWFLANVYFLSKFRMHLQSIANITEKKRSPNNSNVTDKKHHCSLTWKPKMEASTIAITINKTVTAPTVNQSSKSRRIQQNPEKALINSERKKLIKFIFKSKRFYHHHF